MTQHTHRDIDQIIRNRKIIITCGTGGVGKTTLSAAIAIRAATLGRRTVVITIDPAKRLANSLGLKTLGDEPTDLTESVRAAYRSFQEHTKRRLDSSLPLSSVSENPSPDFLGTLSAIMPDTRSTFENFVRELAPNPVAADRVLKNPIFQIFAKEFSGTNEYMALERLLSLHRKSPFDCIILDTPPSRNTLAFLDAPKVLAQFFEERLIRLLVLPANRLLAGGMRKGLSILEKLTGAGFMTNLFDFAAALFEVQANFTGSLKKVTALLESNEVGFLMVTTPTPETLPEAQQFIQTLQKNGFHFEGVALNRTLSYLDLKTSPLGFEEQFGVLQALQERERSVSKNLVKNLIPVCAKIPELARDVHSVEDLFHVAMALNSPFDISSE